MSARGILNVAASVRQRLFNLVKKEEMISRFSFHVTRLRDYYTDSPSRQVPRDFPGPKS